MKISFIFLIFSLFLLVPSVFAHCPLCTAATGAAVAVTRFYGLDDSVVGIFVGGMVVATGLWINNLLKKRNNGKEYLPFQSSISLLVSFILTIATLYFANLIGPNNQFKIFGIDKILFGALIGMIVSFASFRSHDILRTFNRNKNYFPYQSIFIFLVSLAASSFILYLVM
ncbi:MAG: hypothetical protein HYW22_03005 [Candidatus Aenigmarchaeota archaeon]|nr:hypothetical protein [Candidatus Aenigmarchaeota archaeon]